MRPNRFTRRWSTTPGLGIPFNIWYDDHDTVAGFAFDARHHPHQPPILDGRPIAGPTMRQAATGLVAMGYSVSIITWHRCLPISTISMWRKGYWNSQSHLFRETLILS